MVAYTLPAYPLPPTPTLGMGLIGQNSTLSKHCHVAYQHGSCPTPPESKGRNSTFSEHGHVGYQINGNPKCSNMAANILPAEPLLHYPRGGVKRSKFNFFRTISCCISNYRESQMQHMVMWHIKLTGIMKYVSKYFANILPSPLP